MLLAYVLPSYGYLNYHYFKKVKKVKNTNMKKLNKEKMFEIEIAKEYGQELVDKIKLLPDETHRTVWGHEGNRTVYIQLHAA